MIPTVPVTSPSVTRLRKTNNEKRVTAVGAHHFVCLQTGPKSYYYHHLSARLCRDTQCSMRHCICPECMARYFEARLGP